MYIKEDFPRNFQEFVGNNENKEIQYDDFKNFQKLKKHLTALTISLIS